MASSAWKVIPFFKSADIAATVDYYCNHLSFTVHGVYNHDELKDVDMAAIDKSATFCSISLGEKAAANIYFGRENTAGHCMIALASLADLDKYWAGLKEDKVVRVLQEIDDKPWGYRQFEIGDADGNKIMFFAFLEEGQAE